MPSLSSSILLIAEIETPKYSAMTLNFVGFLSASRTFLMAIMSRFSRYVSCFGFRVAVAAAIAQRIFSNRTCKYRILHQEEMSTSIEDVHVHAFEKPNRTTNHTGFTLPNLRESTGELVSDSKSFR